jgi:hypothetical protein
MKNDNQLIRKKMESQLEIKQYTHEDILQMSNIYFKSNMLPSHLKTPEATYVAMMWCTGLGLHPFLGLRDIFVIDNIPSLRTEAALALVEASGFSENIEQVFTGTPYDDDYTAVCIVHRKGRKPHTSTFSVKDAKDAHLWGKKTKTGQDTSWVMYKKRMMMYRAVGFALRDIYPDVLRGARLYEELVDYSSYEIVNDKSTSDSVNVTVQKKSNSNGRVNFSDLPPVD